MAKIIKNKLAIFDIDGTIFRSSLLIELVDGLIEAKVFPKLAKSYFEDSHEKWRERKEGYDSYIMDVVRSYLHFIKETRRSDVWKVADKVIKKQQNYTYRWTRDLVVKLAKTHYLLAISHSPFEMVSPFAKNLGFEKTYGQVYEVDKRVRYTGGVLYQDLIMHKDQIVERFLEKTGMTLKGSIGVGDSESDVAFLKLVEKPIAFNPSSGLYKIAKKNKWKVVVERKDVVYEL